MSAATSTFRSPNDGLQVTTELRQRAKEKLLGHARFARTPWILCFPLALVPTLIMPRLLFPAAAGVLSGWLTFRHRLSIAGRRAFKVPPEWVFPAAFIPLMVCGLPFQPNPPMLGSSAVWPLVATAEWIPFFLGAYYFWLRGWLQGYAKQARRPFAS